MVKARGKLPRQPLVSVVIPTKNAGPRFQDTLEAISHQAGGWPWEVIMIDSGSSDETLTIGRSYGAQVVSIPPSAFNHGDTRNEGIRRARGEYVILLVQDAVPANQYWLGALVETLQQDPRAAGAYSRHLARPDDDYLSRYVAEFWHRQVGGRQVQEIADPVAFQRLPWISQCSRCAFNNVSAIIRRSVWQKHPFPRVNYAEDMAWAKEVLAAGYRIIYEPESMVLHTHRRPALYELRRAFVDARALATLFSWPGQPLSVPQAEALLRYFEAESSLADSALADNGESAAVPALAEAFCQGEDWYRAHFDRLALRHLLGAASLQSEADRRYLLAGLDRRERLNALRDGARADAGHPPISSRLEQGLAAGQVSPEDLAFVFNTLWWELGRDYARQAVLSALQDQPADPLDDVQREQRSFADVVLRGALATGSLTYPLYWRVRLYAAAWAIGRRLGLASLAPSDPAEEPYWQNLVERWTPGI